MMFETGWGCPVESQVDAKLFLSVARQRKFSSTVVAAMCTCFLVRLDCRTTRMAREYDGLLSPVAGAGAVLFLYCVFFPYVYCWAIHDTTFKSKYAFWRTLKVTRHVWICIVTRSSSVNISLSESLREVQSPTVNARLCYWNFESKSFGLEF
jgi:hypothetical protein